MTAARRSFALLAALALVLAGCGDDAAVLGSTTAPGEVTSTTSLPATTTLPPSTTGAPTTTTEAAPSTTEPAPSTTEAPTTTTTLPAPAVPVLTPLDLSESYDDPPLEMDVVIPVVSGVPAPAADAINTAITTDALGMSNWSRDDILATEPPPGVVDAPSEVVLAYTPKTVRADLLSIRFDFYVYYQGGAHGQSFVFTLNFDPRTGHRLVLAQVLVPGTIPAVAAMVEQHLVDELFGGDAAEAADWLPVLDAAVLDAWAVTPDGIEFSFDQYEVGFGAMGAPTVLVPWAELGAVVDPDGPAGGVASG